MNAPAALAQKQAVSRDPHAELNDLLAWAGVSKTVYSYVMPETEAMLDKILDAERESVRNMYREAWTQKQDAMHEEFFETWKRWSAPVLRFNEAEFPWFYTTGGASEALREAIYAYGLEARKEGYEPVIHVFTGDYEGFSAYAESAGIRVVTHSRGDWQKAAQTIGAREQVYLSQPSAIDGNVWEDFTAFVNALYKNQPSASVMLDLTYVGCVAREFRVEAFSPNIRAIFFSLSKPMGVYYHRIGGLLSRSPYPGLFGNKWFKNLLSLRLGTRMMQQYGVHELPRHYAQMQVKANAIARDKLGLAVTPSDVWLLSTSDRPDNPSSLESYLLRGAAGEERLRLCLTPVIAQLVDPATNGTVRARPHEKV